MPNLNIQVSEKEYERLKEIKETHGLTWRGLIIQGASAIDANGPLD